MEAALVESCIEEETCIDYLVLTDEDEKFCRDVVENAADEFELPSEEDIVAMQQPVPRATGFVHVEYSTEEATLQPVEQNRPDMKVSMK